MEYWVWAVLLLAVGLSLAILEVFLPSAGMIGFLAACSIVAAIIMAFRQGTGVGLSVLAGALLAVPMVVMAALYYWPKTPLGRRMLLTVPDTSEVLPNSPQQRYLKGLIGRVGQAKSKMLPSGAVVVDGRTIDAVSEGMPVEIGQRVRVIEVRGNRVVVRPTEDEVASADETDPLARPIDTVLPDPFGEPPA
jgi:membrane-bound ClpP family serine protease